jgi:predicted dehydrogenase
MSRYRVAIIGAGRIGCEFDDCHARAYKENPNTELVAIIDKRFDKALEAAKKWNVPITGDEYWQLGELGLDIVSICTPPQTHYSVLKDMLIANPQLSAIYCEKPIAIDLEDAHEMIAACKERNVILQINHQRRFGTPTFFYSRGLFNTGTHMVDLLRQYFGEVISVEKGRLLFKDIIVDINEIDVTKSVFEFKIPTNDLIKKGVEHLIDCIKNKHESISSGEEALKTLEVLWKIKQS